MSGRNAETGRTPEPQQSSQEHGILRQSFEEYVNAMSPQELHGQLEAENANLADLGVRMPIGWMLDKAQKYGVLYEDRRYGEHEHSVKPTAMNSFMALLRYQPELRNLEQEQFEKLGKTVSRISVTTDALIEKTGGVVWQGLFAEEPQRTPKATPKQ